MKSLWLLLFVQLIFADEHSHTYQDMEQVVVWVDSVGPMDNRQELYELNQLPICFGTEQVHHKHETLGEALMGVQLTNLGTSVKFKQPLKNQPLCQQNIENTLEIDTLKYAIQNQYWYQVIVDDLSSWVFVGQVEKNDVYVFTHREFSIGYNQNQIVEVNISTGSPIKVDATLKKIPFTYSVEWKESSVKFEDRWKKYLDSEFFEHKIHWFSIFNSFMMVIFLVGLVAVIMLRTISRDYARYDKDEGLLDFDRDLGDEYGWKQVHGDVFRPPQRLTWISAMVGVGIQLFVLALIMILYTILGDLYLERATMLTASIFIYSIASIIAGYYSGSYYAKYGGKNWIKTMMVTAGLWPGICGLVSLLINFIAIYKISSKAIPFGTMVAVLAIWLFLIFPLTLFGAIVGKNWAGEASFPCRVNPIPRPVPDKAWYYESLYIIMLSGLLPFGSIFIETYFLFTSFWAPNKTYYVYGFMLLVFIIVSIVTCCVSVVSTYFLLNSEEHRWHWTNFFASGSTAFYVFVYSIYYFIVRTKMHGLFQTVWYFGYMALACFGLFLLLGSIGHLTAERFIRKIYSNVKID